MVVRLFDRSSLIRWLLPGAVLLLVAGLRGACAQIPDTPAATNPPAATVTVEMVEDLRKRAETTELSEDQKKQIATLTQQSLDDLRQADEYAASALRASNRKDELPTVREKLNEEVAELQRENNQRPDSELSLSELDTGLLERRHALTAKIGEFEAYVAEMQARPARRETLRKLLLAQPQEMEALKKQLETPVPEGTPPLVVAATQLANEARRLRLERLPVAMQNELALYDAEDALDIPRLRREKLDREVHRIRREVQLWELEAAEKRKSDIERRIDDARSAVRNADGAASLLFDENLRIAQEERQVRIRAARVRTQEREAVQQFDELTQKFDQIKDRERKAAGSTALGLRLRQQREQLVNPDDLRHEVASRLETVETARLSALDRSDQLDKLTDLDLYVNEFVAQNPTPSRLGELHWDELVRYGFEQRKEFLTELEKAYDEYTDSLDDLEREQEALASLSEEIRSFIDERVLWIRSHRAVRLRELFDERASLVRAVAGDWLPEAGRVLKADVWHRPELYGTFFVVLLVLLCDRRRQRRRIEELAKAVTSRVTVDLRPTMRVTLLTFLQSALWPGLLMFLAWRLGAAAERSILTRDLGHNLACVASILLLLTFTGRMVRADGLTDAHFRWSGRVRSRLQVWIRRLTRYGLPLMFAVAILNALDGDVSGDFWERVAFSALLLLFAWALRDLMHPNTGVLTECFAMAAGGWLDRLRPVWTAVCVFLPVLLAGLSLYGYHYTSKRLAEKLVVTIALIEFFVIIWGLLTRWLMLRHRQLAIDQARARRATLAETATSGDESIARYIEATEQKADLTHFSTQSQRLVNTSLTVFAFTALWLAWADVLPALNYFNTTAIWPGYVTTMETVNPTGSGSEPSTVSVQIPSVTWADLIRAVVVVVLTFTAARNLPGLLEITVLENLPIEASIRFAVTTFARYAIVLLGIVTTASLLGLTWSSVQWLAAALTFGLAFGLQEIFANFISGIIILFERPVRVGDVVTIDNVTGNVSRIRTRSTTITDWDRKEYIVPNKEFITGKLLNWTLTDSINRIVIPVRVAMESDPDQVRALIFETIGQLEHVLKDPAPSVNFDRFDDSGLTFMVRVFLPTLSERINTTHALHSQILRRFRDAGIHVPISQQDIYIRSVPRELALNMTSGPEASPMNSPMPQDGPRPDA